MEQKLYKKRKRVVLPTHEDRGTSHGSTVVRGIVAAAVIEAAVTRFQGSAVNK
jgi:hypothetical protein